jgi:HD-like signal output (HDOD) protein
MFQDELAVKLGTVEDLPTLPSIVLELERMFQNEAVGIDKLAVVIEQDPAITSNLLRVANSVIYYSSVSGTFASVRDAIVRLGFKEVARLVTTVALIRTFERGRVHLNAARFWRSSLRAAVATRAMAPVERQNEMGPSGSST